MAVNWLDHVRKYAPDADEVVVDKIVKYLGIALRNRDSSLVSFTDSSETDRVRDNFLKKKLGLTHSDADLDAAIQGVGATMKGDRTKNRVTVYYLLAQHFGLLNVFGGSASPVKAAEADVEAAEIDAKGKIDDAADTSKAKLAAAGAAVAAAAATAKDKVTDTATDAKDKIADTASDAKDKAVEVASDAKEKVEETAHAAGTKIAAAGAAVAGAAALAGSKVSAAAHDAGDKVSGAADAVGDKAHHAYESFTDDSDGGGMGWLKWLLLAALLVLALFFLLKMCNKHEGEPVTGAGTEVSSTATTGDATMNGAVDATTNGAAAATNGAAAAVPAGADAIGAERDGKPMLTVYFDTGKSEVSNNLATAALNVKSYLDANPAATLAVSGFNDPTGNAAANAALSKSRAENVKAALVAAGFPADKITLEKPADATGTGATNAKSRRVEVVVKG